MLSKAKLVYRFGKHICLKILIYWKTIDNKIKTDIFLNSVNQETYQEHQHATRENYESVTIMVVPVYLKQTVNNNKLPTQRNLINQHKAQSRPSYCD